MFASAVKRQSSERGPVQPVSDRHDQLLPSYPCLRGPATSRGLSAACNVNPAGRPACWAASAGGRLESQKIRIGAIATDVVGAR